MKKLLISLSLSIVSLAANANQEYRLYSKDKKKYESLKTFDHEGLILSESCKKKDKIDCQALTAKPTIKLKDNGVPLAGHPASKFCRELGGKNRIVFDSKNNQHDFCLFADGSMADSWSLHSKLGPKK